LAHEQTISVPHEKVYLGSAGSRVAVGGFFFAIVGFASAVYFGLRSNNELLHSHFWHSYLWSFVFFLAITLGALFFVMGQHLSRAGWSVLVRRVAEGIAGNMLLMLLLLMPLVYLAASGNLTILYHWAEPGITKHDKILAGKSVYLNVGMWVARSVGILIVWTIIAFAMRKNSIAQDTDGSVARSKRMEKMSAAGLIFGIFSLTAVAFDLMLSLNGHWFSTMWGVYYLATCALSFFSSLVLVLLFLQKRGMLGNLVTQEHFHDLGKWMFAFTFFWGYIAFSQYMLIWYANIPEETQFYIPRQIGPWGALSILLIVVHLIIPFPGLLSRHVKRKMPVLAFWAVWSLFACLLDMFYIVIPSQWIHKVPEWTGHPHDPLGHALPDFVASHNASDPAGHGIYAVAEKYWQHYPAIEFPLFQPMAWVVAISVFVGMAGLYVATTMIFLKRAALVPLKDPRLPESLKHENV
jgi:hypothetical protein